MSQVNSRYYRNNSRIRTGTGVRSAANSRNARSAANSRGRGKKRGRKQKNLTVIVRLIFALVILAVIAGIIFGVYKLYGFISEKADSEVKVTTVTVARNGTIKETIIEEFNPGFYDESSLKSDVEKRIKETDGRVRSEGLGFDNGVVTLELEYDSDEDMAAFNDVVFYADTIDNLVSQGVTFDSAALKAGGTNAVIVSDTMDVKVPKKILYTGGSMAVDEENPRLAHSTADEGEIAFLIY
ncbi:MAG: hypothetical protein J5966_03510 [Lachnospiraceae bacterium]|nr:hypothetical protein [Lachnospiraceae bacterium]